MFEIKYDRDNIASFLSTLSEFAEIGKKFLSKDSTVIDDANVKNIIEKNFGERTYRSIRSLYLETVIINNAEGDGHV